MKTRQILWYCWLHAATCWSGVAGISHSARGEAHDGLHTRATRIRVTPSSFDGAAGLAELKESVAAAEIVYLEGSDRGEASMAARSRTIQLLHRELGFEVLVLPVGIFEGATLNRRLGENVPISNASETLYRVWRESEQFNTILSYCRSTHSTPSPLKTAGYKCRFHATAKAIYPEHLFAFFDHLDAGLLSLETRKLVQTVLGTRNRLSRDTVAKRDRARSLTRALIETLDKSRVRLETTYSHRRVALERKFLENMLRFVELEDLRASGSVPKSFTETEAAEILDWFVENYFFGKKLIIWKGADG